MKCYKCSVLILIVYGIFIQTLLVGCNDDARTSPEVICRQPFVIGDCQNVIFYWSYDASKGLCVEQNGCGSNENKFFTKNTCEKTCAGILDGPYSSHESEETMKVKAFERVGDPVNTDDF